MAEKTTLSSQVILAHCTSQGLACLNVDLDNGVWVIRVEQVPDAATLLELGAALKALGARWVSVEVADGN